MADSWFIVPIEEVPSPGPDDGSVDRRPMYAFDDGVESYAGTIYHFDASEPLPFAGQDMYVIRCYGPASVLDTLTAHSDVYSIWAGDATPEEVTSYLNDRHGQTRTWEEWQEAFQTGTV